MTTEDDEEVIPWYDTQTAILVQGTQIVPEDSV